MPRCRCPKGCPPLPEQAAVSILVESRMTQSRAWEAGTLARGRGACRSDGGGRGAKAPGGQPGLFRVFKTNWPTFCIRLRLYVKKCNYSSDGHTKTTTTMCRAEWNRVRSSLCCCTLCRFSEYCTAHVRRNVSSERRTLFPRDVDAHVAAASTCDPDTLCFWFAAPGN